MKTTTGISIPLMVFCLSALMLPEWKGDCKHGWLDCFHRGKLMILPLVLFATAAFYTLQIIKLKGAKDAGWISIGMIIGAVTSSLCTVIGVIIVGLSTSDSLWLLVPFYTAVWYTYLTIRLRPRWLYWLISQALSAPFWIMTVIMSKNAYRALPNQPPDCFVVTATLRGHRSLIGPLTVYTKGDVPRLASRQLMTFWQLEAVWQKKSPATHRCFRRVYNRIGPIIARRIQSPLLADLTHLVLKPFEYIAFVIVHLRAHQTRGKSSVL